MRKLKRIVPILMSALMLFAGCQKIAEKVEESTYDKIQKQLLNLETYAASANVTYISNKNKHTYETAQYVKITGEYRIEVTGPEKVSGNVTIFDGKTVAQFNSRISGKLLIGTQDSAERYEILLTSFVKNYVKSQNVSISVANMDESVCTVLEAKVPGEHPYLSSEKLWIDNQTLQPVKLVIYDPDGGERVVVEYSEFSYNVSLDDNIFKIQQ